MSDKRHTRKWEIELGVVGLRFRVKKDARAALARIVDKTASGLTGIRLEREPDNPADENAVMVLLPEKVMEGAQLGYLHRQSAELLAPSLDMGEVEFVSAKLLSLDHSTDHDTGILLVEFRTAALAAKGKPRVKGKAADKIT